MKKRERRSAKFKSKSTIDLAGSGSEYASTEEMKHFLNKLREEAFRYKTIRKSLKE